MPLYDYDCQGCGLFTALRPMADVDLLVRGPDVRGATQLLRSLGYAGTDGELLHQEPIDGNMHVEPMRKPGGLLVEIHYALLAPALVKGQDVDGIWSRTRSRAIGGTEAKVLSPEDLLLHLCLHAALNHGFQVNLLHLCDIPAVVDHFGDRLDWTAFRNRARAWGAERSVEVTLALAGRLLGWEPPARAAAGGTPPPAPFDVVALAERLLFETGAPFVASANLPRLWGDASLGEKARLVFRRTFPSRAEMGFTYGVPASSWAIPVLYPVRLGQLLARYARPMVRAASGSGAPDPALEVAKERSRLVEWLAAGPGPASPPGASNG